MFGKGEICGSMEKENHIVCPKLNTETIKWYRKKLLAKFDADNAASLIRKALAAGLI